MAPGNAPGIVSNSVIGKVLVALNIGSCVATELVTDVWIPEESVTLYIVAIIDPSIGEVALTSEGDSALVSSVSVVTLSAPFLAYCGD